MFYKKLGLIALLSVLLSSCSMNSGSEKKFSEFYEEQVETQISSLREFAKDLGYMENYKSLGSMKLAADIPAILKGAFSSNYEAKVDGQDVELIFSDPKMSYETLLASGSMEAKTLAMITKGGDLFFRYIDMKASLGMMDAKVSEVIGRYTDTWLSLTETEVMNSLSGSSEEEILSYKISDAISKMTLADLEDYLKKYPLWKEEKDLGMSGSLHSYEVSLHRESVLSMIEDFTKKATGKDMLPESKAGLQAALESLAMTGIVSFDPKDKNILNFLGNITPTEGDPLGITFVKSKDSTKVQLVALDDILDASIMKTGEGHSFGMSIRTEGTESVKLTGKMKHTDEKFENLSMSIEAPMQGLTLTLDHTLGADGGFEGKINAGLGNMTWKGKLEKKSLTELEVSAAVMGSSLEMKLIPDSTGFLKGPLSVKSGDATIISANIGLRANNEEFTFTVEIPSPEDPSLRSYAEISITGKRSEWSGDIEIPKETKSFQEFSDALSDAMPIDPYMMEMDEAMENSDELSLPIESNLLEGSEDFPLVTP